MSESSDGQSFPWYSNRYKLDGPAGNGQITAIRTVLAAQRAFQEKRLIDDYCASWLYQRDFQLAQYKTAHASLDAGPDGASDRFPWIKEDFEIQSPSIVKQVTRTIVAWLFAEVSGVGVRASGAKFEQHSSIEQYGLALDGIFNTPNTQDTLRVVARDGTLKGIGCAMPEYADGEIKVRRLVPHQVQYDAYDSRDGDPRCVYVSEYRDRQSVRAWIDGFGNLARKQEKLELIDNVASMSAFSKQSQTWSIYDWELSDCSVPDTTDRIKVVHCWRKATAPGTDDGRYTVAVMGTSDYNARTAESDGGILIDQSFSRTTFPVCFWTPDPNDEGIRGSGLYHDLHRWQGAIDRTMYKIQKVQDDYGHYKVFVKKGSVQNKSAFANAGIDLVEVESMAELPKPLKAVPISREDIEWVDKLISMAFSITGVNQLMATGGSRLGAGASAVAMIEEDYRSVDRFADVLKRWERFRLDLAREALYVLDDVIASDKKFAARYEYKGDDVTIPWASLRKLTAGTLIDVEPRGPMANTRASRMSKIIDMAGRNLIDEATAQEMMLSTPDVRKAARLSLAGLRLVEWQIHNLIINKSVADSMPTDDFDDRTLATSIDQVTKQIFLAIVEGANSDTIQRLREYKYTAEQMANARMPQPPPEMGGMPGVPPSAELAAGVPG